MNLQQTEKWHVYVGGNFVKVVATGYEEYVEQERHLSGPLCIADVNYHATADYSEDAELAIIRAGLLAEAPNLYRDNQVLRKLLWLNHGCPISALYGDDGEMQCGRCGMDFKRLAAIDIERCIVEQRIKELEQEKQK